jgi:hypothetical protein
MCPADGRDSINGVAALQRYYGNVPSFTGAIALKKWDMSYAAPRTQCVATYLFSLGGSFLFQSCHLLPLAA